MILITLAHLGEAESIIKDFNLQKIRPDYFKGDGLACLITGEGPFEAAVKTSAQLARAEYQKVVNIGICGALNAELPVGSILTVRSCYLVVEGKPQFKTFNSGPKGLDLITSFERILSPEKLPPLQGLGELVDREAWGVMMAAKEAQLPTECYKLVSDQAGTLGACEAVREKAQQFSAMLSGFLQQSLHHSRTTDIAPSEVRTLGPDFHFTFSMQKQFQILIKKLSIRENKSQEEILREINLKNLQEQKILPKERALRVLRTLEQRLDPFKGELDKALHEWKENWEKKGIGIATDPSWESSVVKLSLEVQKAQDLTQKIEVLKSFDLEHFEKLRKGEIHVE